ncbi:MAG: Uma2 family endonuclease [Pyrinomonadaceae bacterium]|nr:Uma2 family endonuclease [Pyrinomonadaceae bacterium]
MQTNQIVIDITPDKYFSPEISVEARELEREVYFSRLVSKSALNEFEQREYENFLDEFITEDDEPVDNGFSEKQQKLLTRSLYASWQPFDAQGEPQKFVTMANVGIFTRLRPSISPVVPDVLVSLETTGEKGNISERRLRSYLSWELGKVPELVVEIVSNQIGEELTDKMRKYAQIGIKYYAVFDPERHITDDVLQIFELIGNRYELRNDYVLPALGLRLIIWEGKFENWQERWIRWRDNSNGELLLTGEERAEIETLRADEESQRADEEAQRAEIETQRADEEARRAEIEMKRADKAEERAELEAKLAVKLAEKLRELGINPGEI